MAPAERVRISTTYSGHPVACAAALRNLQLMDEEEMLRNARERGIQLRRELADQHIGEVRGTGLFVGLEVETSTADKRKAGAALVRDLFERKFLVRATVGQVGPIINVSPALVISSEQTSRLAQAIAAVVRHRAAAAERG
jgi:adenosylmethionine-8-amino-7-oxononanoate aminotransferase